MQQRTQELAQLVASNRQEISKAYKVASSDKLATAALTWSLAGRQASADTIRQTRDHLRSQAGVLSAERGENQQTLIAYMALADDQDAYLARVRAAFNTIMEGKKMATNARFSEAIVIANNTSSNDEAAQKAQEAEDLFNRMREAHPWITDDHDRSFAALMSLTSADTTQVLEDAEKCYQLLGDGYKMSEGRQTMANVLSLFPGTPEAKVQKLNDLRAAFKANKISIGWTTSVEFAILALLVGDDRTADEIAADVAQVYAFIRKQKGFGTFSLTGAIRLIIAAVISTSAYSQQQTTNSVATALSGAIVQAIMDWIVLMAIIVVQD